MVISKISEDRSFHWYLIQQILTTPEQATFGEKNPLPILLFTYYSLQIKFVPLLERKPAKISCKNKRP